MSNRKLVAGVAMLGRAMAGSGVAVAANNAAAPKRTTVKVSGKFVMKRNRYVQDGMRWDKDVWRVRSGGTLHIVNTNASEGPHTFTVVRKKDLPRNAAQMNNCQICNKLGAAH